MDVADEIVVVERTCPNLHSRHETETELALLCFAFDGGQKKVQIFVGWYVETSVPFAIERVERSEGLVAHSVKSRVSWRLLSLPVKCRMNLASIDLQVEKPRFRGFKVVRCKVLRL